MMKDQETEYRVGMGRADITPQESVRLGGYGARVKPSQGVLDPLMAKAMAIESEDGPAVVIATDLIGFDAPFADLVCRDIRARTGIPPEKIIINSSHTHAGPIFGLRYPLFYGLDPERCEPIARYNQMLRERMVEVVAAALADLKPARLSLGMGAAMFVMNRRRYTPQGVVNAPYPRGYVDRSVPVLRVDDPDGRLRGVVFGYACHNTTLTGENLMISADYAGFAQRLVEKQNPGAQAMFLAGCGADANPYPRGRYDLAHRHGESLGAEACRVLEEPLQPVGGPLRTVSDHVDMPLEPRPSQEQIDALQRRGGYYAQVAEKVQQLFDSGKPWAAHYRTPIAVWQFGGDLTLVRLSGEVVGDYVRLIERSVGPLGLWIAAYCSDYFGYLPSARVHKEGGYEAHDFITGYGYLDASAEAAVVRKVQELARRAGRKVPAAFDR